MKSLSIFLLLLLLSSWNVSAEEAEKAAPAQPQKSEEANPVTTVVTYPVNIVRETGEVALGAGQKALQTGADTAQVTGQVLTGDVKKTPEIIVTPVKGTAEGIVETTKGAALVPVEAMKDSQEAGK